MQCKFVLWDELLQGLTPSGAETIEINLMFSILAPRSNTESIAAIAEPP